MSLRHRAGRALPGPSATIRLAMLCAVACLCLWLSPAQAQMRSAKRCDETDLRQADEGSTCRSSVDAEFQRFRNPVSGALGWRDLQAGGRVWYDTVKINAAQIEADKWCAKYPGEGVPSPEDYDLGNLHAFAEVIGETYKDLEAPLLYSSKIDTTATGERAVGFSPKTAHYQTVPANQSFDNAMIICVSLPVAAP